MELKKWEEFEKKLRKLYEDDDTHLKQYEEELPEIKHILNQIEENLKIITILLNQSVEAVPDWW